MFNFRSLAAMIGNEDDKEDREDAAKHIEHLKCGGESSRDPSEEGTSHTTGLEESVATLKVDNSNGIENTANSYNRQTTLLEPHRTTPEVTLTTETPAATSHSQDDGKQLGAGWAEQIGREITQ